MAVTTVHCWYRIIMYRTQGTCPTSKTFCRINYNCTIFGRSKSSSTDKIIDCPAYNEDKSKDSSNKSTVHFTKIVQYLSKELLVSETLVKKVYMSHPKRRFIQMNVVKDSVNYLLNMGFTKSVIAESLSICFYPRENIKYGLDKIVENEDELSKVGFTKGYVPNETKNFINGTVSRNKKLELCLYYLESPFGFSGARIISILDVQKMASTSDISVQNESSKGKLMKS